MDIQTARLINIILSAVGLIPLFIVAYDLIKIYVNKKEKEKKLTALLLIAIVLSIIVYFVITEIAFVLVFLGVQITTIEQNYRHFVQNMSFNVVSWCFLAFEKMSKPKLFNHEEKKK